jgi:hypothetical protein
MARNAVTAQKLIFELENEKASHLETKRGKIDLEKAFRLTNEELAMTEIKFQSDLNC